MGSVQDFILLYLWLVWIKRNGRQWESKITNTNGGKLLRRPLPFELRILSWESDTKLLHIMPLLLEWGGELHFFVCMCSRNCIIIIIINIIVYITVVVVCQNRQVNELYKCKHEISDSLHYSIFFILFCCAELHTDQHVNKDFFLFGFFSKDSWSCCKVGAMHV